MDAPLFRVSVPPDSRTGLEAPRKSWWTRWPDELQLVDTCALLALARGELPDRAAAAMRSATEAHASAVSSWEVAIKVAGGRVRLTEPPLQWFLGLAERYDLREVPLDARTACAAAALPAVHRDPSNRVVVALAHAHALTILTSDEDIAKYPGIKTLW